MSVSRLSLVSPAAETPAMRASRLLAEARDAAGEQVRALEQALLEVAEIAREIAAGGAVYPAGVRDLCRRLSEEVVAKSQTMEALLQQSGAPDRR
jgi:hypothetical protein